MSNQSTDQRDIVERLRSRGWEDRQHRQLREEAAREIERLRAEMKRVNDLAVHLNSGGRDPNEKCYSKRDVEALIAVTQAVRTKHSLAQQTDAVVDEARQKISEAIRRD